MTRGEDEDGKGPRGRSRARTGGSATPLGHGSIDDRGRSRSPRSGGREGPADAGDPGRSGSAPRGRGVRVSSGRGQIGATGPISRGSAASARGRTAGSEEPLSRGGALDDDAGPSRRPEGRRRRRRGFLRLPRRGRLGVTVLVLVLVLVLGWGGGLALWANSRLTRVDALSGTEDTSGVTYLLAGSDSRDNTAVADDGTKGQRTDTMMLLHKARNGKSYLVSLPRDTLVDIPGHGKYKLNAAYAFGGPSLLVQTVEQFTGLSIDHYVEVGFDGIVDMVDAVGSVNLCLDQDVDDPKSGLKWTSGCHDADGQTALSFVRARYFDPTADLGRQERQRQFVSALTKAVVRPGVLLNPISQVKVAGAAADTLTVDRKTGIIDLGRMALAFKGASPQEMPIENPAYPTKHSGVAIKVDDAAVSSFFTSIRDGSL